MVQTKGQQHRGVFELYIPPETRCPSCNRRYDEGERPSSYAGVKVCAGCYRLGV